MYGPAGHRKATMSPMGWAWCVMFNSNLAFLYRDLPKLPGVMLMVLKVLARLPVTIPAAFWHDPMRFMWNLVTLPVFLLLIPPAALASYYNHRDVFPMAYQWTHWLLAFGHRWAPGDGFYTEIYEFCRVCRVCRAYCRRAPKS
jgi:hypothetical protein